MPSPLPGVVVRPEAGRDYAAIRDLLIAAFAAHPHSIQTEHLIVEALRAAGAMTLALVAEVDGAIAGHIAFSPVLIGGLDRGWFALGPVAVLPALQGRGIGTKLVEAGLEAIRGLGARGCFLVGDPAYYRRFGFGPVPELTCEGVPQEYVMGVALEGEIPAGPVAHHAAFFVTP